MGEFEADGMTVLVAKKPMQHLRATIDALTILIGILYLYWIYKELK